MNKEQVKAVRWLYQFAIKQMNENPDKFPKAERLKLTEAISLRFPQQFHDITVAEPPLSPTSKPAFTEDKPYLRSAHYIKGKEELADGMHFSNTSFWKMMVYTDTNEPVTGGKINISYDEYIA